MKRWSILSACLVVLASACLVQAAPSYPQRWVYTGAKLNDDAGLAKLVDVLKLAKECGCTHVLMPEAYNATALTLSEDPAYLARVAKVKELAKELNLTIVPQVYAFGYALRYLELDPMLAAGLPVRDMPFIVHGKAASPDPSLAVDTSSLKPDETGKIDAKLPARPFTHYRLSFVMKGDYTGDRDEMLRISTDDGKRWVTRRFPTIKKVDGKNLVETTFNTLELEGGQMRVQIFVPAEDIKIEPAGTLMILRRDLLPLKVTSADGQTVYEEGKDFKRLEAPEVAQMAKDELSFTVKGQDIQLTANSRIEDGQKLLVSFWHAYRVYGDQNIASMEDPRIMAMMEKDVANCVKVWGTSGYFMNYDEIRIAGWEPRADGRKLSPGQMLSEHTRMSYDLIHKYAPQAQVYTWSDMYSPYQNAFSLKDANKYYYLVNGNWDGAWEGLPKDIIIMNWVLGDAKGIQFFAEKGHSQVFCGYYDAGKTEPMKKNISGWIKASEGCQGIRGFMYTTWQANYSHMKEYFQLLDTADAWMKAAAATQP